MSEQQTQLAEPSKLATLHTGINIFDSGSFESILRVADAMAFSPLVPESLRTKKVGGNVTDLSHEEIRANCFLVCEQAARWSISPFAALSCASNIHGRLMWEGKLVAGVLEANLGVRLNYTYEGAGENLTVTVIGTLPGETEPRTVKGNVRDWKTAQWTGSAYEQRLAYRGAREWARRHSPAVMLGVYTDDEAPEMRNITPNRGDLNLPEVDPFKKEAMPEKTPEEPKPAQTVEAQAIVEDKPKDKTEGKRLEEPSGSEITEATFRSVTTEKQGRATIYVITLGISGKAVQLYSASPELFTRLSELKNGNRISATISASQKDPTKFILDNFETIKPDGSLL